ncbi:MAG: ABC transporter permease [Chloroflexi bacterium]|nr:ABC transporter permease [Chloroflexota bacterium]MCL5274195.1 ABC transporter permease [Chloroflexota bacterium]
MGSYILRRLGYMAVTLLIVTILGYIIIELPPGSYVESEVERLRAQGGNLTQGQIDALYRRYGLDKPEYVRFWLWISAFVRGDFGQAFAYNLPVSQIIFDRLGLTLAFSLSSLVFSWVVAIAAGVYSATHRYTLPDYVIAVLQFIGLAVPNFLLALVLMVFAQNVFHMQVAGLFSSQYVDAPWSIAKVLDLLNHLWIPIIVIGASNTAWLSRVMRANLLDVLNMQYVQTARAKGLTENVVVWKHAFRNAIHPLIMVLGSSLPGIISGETIVAIVLNLPTTGPIYFNALIQKDMYLAGAFLVFLAIALLIGNLGADILLAWVDPRIRYE